MKYLPMMLTTVFVTLKLVGVIDWSWWWVLSPFLCEVFLFVLVVGVALAVYLFLDGRGG